MLYNKKFHQLQNAEIVFVRLPLVFIQSYWFASR